MRGRRAVPIELNEDERKRLKRITRCYTLPHQEVIRAKAILLANEGVGNAEIARRLETHHNIVGKWRKRFLKDRENGLKNMPRSGAPSDFSPSGETPVH